MRRFLGFDVHFDFGTKAHTAIAIGVRLGVNQAGAAMSFVRLAARDFGGHVESGLDGHADLKRGGSDKEESAARDVGGLGEMLGSTRRQSHRTKTKWNANAKALELSAFRRGHAVLPTRKKLQ